MTPSHNRCRLGKRLRMGYPRYRRMTTTAVRGPPSDRDDHAVVLDGPVYGNMFEDYVDQVFVPELKVA